jgi:hypothetical protein
MMARGPAPAGAAGAGPRVLVSVEQELLTVVEGAADDEARDRALSRLLKALRELAPSVPSHRGCFNGYGRVYVDTGQHLEIALAECDSPYLAPLVLERQQALLAGALRQLEASGESIVLANNNHGGLLGATPQVWGAHENFLVTAPPLSFTRQILPFLVSRFYAGAGAVQFPSARFLAGVRPEFMEQDIGGNTTGHRAIHSTCREEHHVGSLEGLYRYHPIIGDGHRSQFNLALQLGATALALQAICGDADFDRHLSRLPPLATDGSWLRALRAFNVLAEPGAAPRVHPAALGIQNVYLEASRSFAARQEASPEWAPRLLDEWQATLDAAARGDDEWLSRRLDAFIKHKLFSRLLEARGVSWTQLPRRLDVFYELALSDQDYHEFAREDSVFHRLEAAKLLSHRVGESVAPGGEAEAFVPETSTRARARARFIKEHAGAAGETLCMDWAMVYDLRKCRVRKLYDPFAAEYGPWEVKAPPE